MEYKQFMISIIIIFLTFISTIIIVYFVKRNYKEKVALSIDGIAISLSNILKDISINQEEIENNRKEILDKINNIIEEFHSPLLVTVLGEFSSGKSTFINSLIGKKFLPMKVRPTTATITVLQYSEEEYLEVKFKNNEIKRYPMTDIEKFVVEKFINQESIVEDVFYVKVGIPCELLRHFDIADTPGFNSQIDRHTQITTEFLKYSDMIFWVFDACQLGKKTELDNINNYCSQFIKPIAIVNKMDQLVNQIDKEKESIKSIKNSYSKLLKNYVQKVFFISAKDALYNVKNSNNEIKDILGYIKKEFIKNEKKCKEKAILAKLAYIVNDILDHFNMVKKELSERYDSLMSIQREIEKFLFKKEKYNNAVKKWNSYMASGDFISILSDLSIYFPFKNVKVDFQERASKLINEYDSIIMSYKKLDAKKAELNKTIKNLQDELNLINMRWNEYYNRYLGLKSFFDDLFGDVTEEKKSLNKDSYAWDKKRDTYNSEVEKYNRKVNETNSNYDHWIECCEVLISEIAADINSQTSEYIEPTLNHLEPLKNKAVNDYNICENYYLKIETELPNLLKQFKRKVGKQIVFNDEKMVFDISRKINILDDKELYSRKKLENIVKINVEEYNFSNYSKVQMEQMPYENREAPKIN